ncbi:DNA polymerase III subunit gamma/tau (fragment) [Cupriavidus oxalaticus]|uniref:DNA polymerase III subunit gamma/tau n=1 Tax=Cupriavidus oxalaticus TaxID=96344 RepID=A0A976BBK3_9BURK
MRAPGAAAVSRPAAAPARPAPQPPAQAQAPAQRTVPQPPAAPARPALAARQPEPESVPPWEMSGGSDVPPWEDLPPDLPVIGPYDSDPGFRADERDNGFGDNGFSEPPARVNPRNGAARPASAPVREAEAAAPAASAEGAKLVAPRPPAAGEDGSPPVFTGDWPALAVGLPLKGLAQQLAYQSELTQVVGNIFNLRIPVAALGENGVAERLQQVLCDHFGQPVRVLCEVGAVAVTAAAADAQARAERQREAEAAIEADPFVQGLLRDFGGQIVPGSIQPRAA